MHTLAKKLNLFTLLIATLSINSISAQSYEPGLTEYGLPNLQGVWNFSSQTPLERPSRYVEQEFLSPEEIDELMSRRQATVAARTRSEADVSDRILSAQNARSVGSVNGFWAERTTLEENGRTSLIVYPRNGKLPALQNGIEIQRGDQSGVTEIPGTRPVRYTHGGINRNGPEDRGLSERCMVFNSGPPLLSGPYNNNIQIIQNRDHIVLMVEMGFDARIVPLTGAPHIDPAITQWSGDSRGYFDGNTLVVESRNFSDLVASLGLRDKAYGSAKNRLLIERFTPTAPGKLAYEFTIDDPDTFKEKIVVQMPMTQVKTRLYEYACHAGNYAIRNILRAARISEETR
ncbi:MAG: hypothetical protein COA96_05710 [SAR86 cluster bacterium]|uniref:Uncharacterized protein n=1 Tax=SAR86 cluster bacterium TaxID=2030880 RepID=A0A2A5B3V1_9GAMM|nr:MAG: hypothetical protein COA96_05710 [SAR86 cluster bacterium]